MIKAIVFDADDTLWSNEPLFRAAERNCFELLSQYGSREWLNDELYKTEMSNMAELGYGAKAFIISMIETAVRVSGGTVSADTILQIEQAGRAIMRNPAEPLPGSYRGIDPNKKIGPVRDGGADEGRAFGSEQQDGPVRAAAFFRVRGCGQREDGGGVFGALRPHGYRAGGDAYGRKFVQVGYRSGVEDRRLRNLYPFGDDLAARDYRRVRPFAPVQGWALLGDSRNSRKVGLGQCL